MALTGMHVACCYVGNKRENSANRRAPSDIIYKPEWSETLANAGVTTKSAPDDHTSAGGVMFQLDCSVDAFVAVGTNPNASSGARVFVRATETKEIYVNAGDRLAWVAA